MSTNVKSYTDKQLLDFVKSSKGFKSIPENYWVLGVRSNEDENNKFDDKFYVFKGEEFIMVMSGTTNKGNGGTAVMECGWHYDVYLPSDGIKVRHHRDKAPCLRQVKSIPYRRDYTNDLKTNPTTDVFNDIIHMNFHPASYDSKSNLVKTNIGQWSHGCQVWNDLKKGREFLKLFKDNGHTTYCLINEF